MLNIHSHIHMISNTVDVYSQVVGMEQKAENTILKIDLAVLRLATMICPKVYTRSNPDHLQVIHRFYINTTVAIVLETGDKSIKVFSEMMAKCFALSILC